MAKYKIIGADKETGIDTVEKITADSSKEAQILAQSRGLVISSIEQIDDEAIAQSGSGINIVNQVQAPSHRRHVLHEGGGLYALLSFFWPGLPVCFTVFCAIATGSISFSSSVSSGVR